MDGWIIPLIGGSAFRQTNSQVASLKLYRTDCSNVGRLGGRGLLIARSRYDVGGKNGPCERPKKSKNTPKMC